MDIALGVSMASPTIRMVLTEGENADGVTIEQEEFDVPADESVADQVVAAIQQARRGADAAGYQLSSVGVAFNDAIEADLLRNALVRHRVDDVMVISAFLSAVTLTQSAGSSVGDANTALLFVTPDAATVATVNATDGAIADVHRHRLGEGERADELAELVSCVADVPAPPGGVFVVGSGVSLDEIKPELEAATALRVSFPGEPEMALARGAALASANAPLFASSTQAMAWAQDFGTGSVDHEALRRQFVPAGAAGPLLGIDYGATSDNAALAYSALPEGNYAAVPVSADAEERVDSAQLDFRAVEASPRSRLMLVGSGSAAVVVIAVAVLLVSVVIGNTPRRTPGPRTGAHVFPSQEAAPPKPEAPAPPKPEVAPPKPEAPAPKPEAPAPKPEAPAPKAPAPVQAPAPEPVVQAPPPPPAAPPPPPPAPPPVFVPLPIPGLPGAEGPPRHDRGHKRWSPPRHGDDDDDDGHRGKGPKLPIFGDDGFGDLEIPGIPGF